MKDELGGKNMNFLKFYFGLRAKTCSYLIDDGSEWKKQKAQKSVSWKEKLNLKIIKTVLKQLKFKINQTIQEKIKWCGYS